ncbi:PR domain zinc finger protein 13 [Stylophora pistillata]|uniref:PR domain zinc finger protein 13 n=2 Tax=Stylophora pistillata TaxID=50429 RepID=A0A2B4T1Y0_STYPI|nr:PR domain zinc finger protein 13 [Stylophora pistillata]
MSAVHPARSEMEQNLEVIRSPDDDKIYFRTTRDISSGEEFQVWLAPSLEEELGLQNVEKEEFEDSQWICGFCKKIFRCSKALSVHQSYQCKELGSSVTLRKENSVKTVDSEGDEDLEDEEEGGEEEEEEEEEGDEEGDGDYDEDDLLNRNSPKQSLKIKQNSQHQEEKSKSRKRTDDRSHSSADNSQRRCLVGASAPMITEETSVAFGNGRVLSNPALESLISSFTPPPLRKFLNEPQSLAEYHKQEFRKKFQGNEHYLRRHLYRENMERKLASAKHRRLLVRKDDEYSLKRDKDRLSVKREEGNLINCFQESYIQDLHKRSTILPTFPEGEIFRNPIVKSTSGQFNLRDGNFPLNVSAFKNYSNIRSSVGPKELTNNNRVSVANGNDVLRRGDEVYLPSEADRECTCEHNNDAQDISQQKKSSAVSDETTKTRGNEENSTVSYSEQLDQTIHRPDHQSRRQESVRNSYTRLGSYFIHQGMQPPDNAPLRHRMQCQCYSSPVPCEPTDNIARRFYDPAFFVDQRYGYSNYSRMFPFFAHHASNLPQASQRNQGFTCDYCGKVYCRKYVLKIHMRTHTGFKPLRCKVCDKSFSDPSNMKKHVKLHETEDTVHKCRYCGRNFVRYRGLLNHIKSKHSEQISL